MLFQSMWQGLKTVYILLIIVVMGLSGVLAIEAGSTRYFTPIFDANATQKVTQAVKEVQQNPTQTNLKAISNELSLLAELTSVERFSESRLMPLGIFYTTLSPYSKILLAIHVFFAGFCMLVGGFQFWPQFRKRYPHAHRKMGMIYIATVPISLLTVLLYLCSIRPDQLYTHLTGYVALWLLAIISLGATYGAVKSLSAKRIYEHQAYMALSFACLIVAPMLRWNWVLLAWLFPTIDQETLNLVTLTFIVPQCVLFSYGLLWVNRQWLRPMVSRQPAKISQHIQKIFLQWHHVWNVLAVLSVITTLYFYAWADLSSLPAAEKIVSSVYLKHSEQVIEAHNLLKWVFALSISMALLIALRLIRHYLQSSKPSQSSLEYSFIAATFLALLSAFLLGQAIGIAPNGVLVVGGAGYITPAVILAILLSIYLWAVLTQRVAIKKEALILMLAILPFPTLLILLLQTFSYIPFPLEYIRAGHVYVLALGSTFFMLLPAFLYVIYGQATREHN